MGEKLLSNKAMKIVVEDTIQNVMDVFETNDGRTFEEKKKDVLEYLKTQEDTLLAERVLSAAINDETGRCCKEKFWQLGNNLQSNGQVILRKIKEEDKEGFFELQKETSAMKFMLKEDDFRLMLWNEHVQDKSLMVTIEVDGEYAGYCGINNLSNEHWEIAIELREKWRRKGIGYEALKLFLTELKSRIHRSEFRVKIDPDNYASQRLFEKLGAKPYGISEYMLHEEEDIRMCEEENLQEIDEKLIEVAEKFGVEPRKLLSHVLEYSLEW